MKILITGATGSLGSHLVRALLNQGHQVVVLKRSFSDLSRISDVVSSIESYDIDDIDLATPFAGSNRIDVVIHTATCYGRNKENIYQIFEANTVLPLQLLNVAIRYNVSAFVNTDTSLDRFLNPYALSKKQFHDWGILTAAQMGLSFLNLQLEHFYGPGDDDSKFVTMLIRSCLQNVRELNLTAGEQKRDFIHIEDVVSAYLTILKTLHLKKPCFMNYGVGSGDAITIRGLVEKVHAMTEAHTILNFGAVPYRQNEVMESCADIAALRALGWTPKVSLDNGLGLTISYEKQRPQKDTLKRVLT